MSAFSGLMEGASLNATHIRLLVPQWELVKGLQLRSPLMPLGGVTLKGPSCAVNQPPFARVGLGRSQDRSGAQGAAQSQKFCM